jgi:hypothetical protein
MDNKKRNKLIIAISILICLPILIVALSVIYTSITRPKADYDGFRAAMTSYLDQNSDVVQVNIIENDMFKVTVSNEWYNSSNVDKLKFCQNVHGAIYSYASRYKLIYKKSDIVFLNFYDASNIKVAEQDKFEFKILQ